MDDVLVTGTCEVAIIKVKNYLHKQFTIKDIGYTKYFLGLEIALSSDDTYIKK